MTAAEVHVVENGSNGAPTLLLLSNAAAPGAAWEPVVAALAEAHHAATVEHRR